MLVVGGYVFDLVGAFRMTSSTENECASCQSTSDSLRSLFFFGFSFFFCVGACAGVCLSLSLSLSLCVCVVPVFSFLEESEFFTNTRSGLELESTTLEQLCSKRPKIRRKNRTGRADSRPGAKTKTTDDFSVRFPGFQPTWRPFKPTLVVFPLGAGQTARNGFDWVWVHF